MATKAKRETDTIKSAIRTAINAARKAQAEISGDTRTAGTEADSYMVEVLGYLHLAAEWYRDLLREERENEKPDKPSGPVEVEVVCAICENEIESGDDTDCSGCDRKICPGCMGDDGVCRECGAEAE